MVVWDFRLNDVEDVLEFYGWDGMGYPLTFLEDGWRLTLFSSYIEMLRNCEWLRPIGEAMK